MGAFILVGRIVWSSRQKPFFTKFLAGCTETIHFVRGGYVRSRPLSLYIQPQRRRAHHILADPRGDR